MATLPARLKSVATEFFFVVTGLARGCRDRVGLARQCRDQACAQQARQHAQCVLLRARRAHD